MASAALDAVSTVVLQEIVILIAEFSGHGKHLRAGTLRMRQTTGRETQLLRRYF